MHKLSFTIIGLLLLGLASPAFGTKADSLFNAANELYRNQEFDEALQTYLALERENYQSAPLYFNIGNCYFKQGKLGYAILYYLRAKRLNPNDTDIEANLEFARQFMPTRLEGIKINPVEAFMSLVVDPFTLNMIAWNASILFIILVLYLAGIIYFRWHGIFVKIAIYSLIVLVLISSGAATYKFRTEYLTEKGVIIADETRVFSGPGEDNDVEFVGVFGLEFEIEKDSDNYYLVIFENKRKGWVNKDDVEKI